MWLVVRALVGLRVARCSVSMENLGSNPARDNSNVIVENITLIKVRGRETGRKRNG